jgi:(1->4)-alpha-D-glucan 1-alpha-D-glucosylmutase
MEKALHEAKIHSSWLNPSETYDAAIREFISDLLGDKGKDFAADVSRFVDGIADSGFANSLAQLLLKMTMPGVPDFYRGTELWDFNLVDPDNRRPVDYDCRRNRLQQLIEAANVDLAAAARDVARRWPDPDVKLWVAWRSLTARRELPDLFSFGEYIPLVVTGAAGDHVLSFARRVGEEIVVIVLPRLIHGLLNKSAVAKESGSPRIEWQDTRISFPEDFPHSWRSELSGQPLEWNGESDEPSLGVREILSVFPIALLKPEKV